MSTTPTESEIFRDCGDLLRDRFPPDWLIITGDGLYQPNIPIDGLLGIKSPGGEMIQFGVEVKRVVERRDVQGLVQRFLSCGFAGRELVMARYLSEPVRQLLSNYGLSYVDTTGNVKLTASRPALFLRDRGADTDPYRGPGRPRETLKGEPAARVIRTLIASPRSYTVRSLVEASGASTGATYRVLEFLREEQLAEQNSRGEWSTPDWPRLLQRWSKDYSLLNSSRTATFIEPRGLPALMNRISEQKDKAGRYAITGSVAAAQWAPYAPTRAAMIYVESIEQASSAWKLRPTESGANVVLAEPKYSVVFEGSTVADGGYVTANVVQVAVDLLTGPGRNPSEGEELIEWMRSNEQAWRGQ